MQYVRRLSHGLFTNRRRGVFDAYVISGSYNRTKKAQYNDESTDTKHSRETTEPYATKFIK